MGRRKVIVAGALGVIGRAMVEHFVARGDTVVGLSRREPEFESGAEFVAVDLRSAEVCRRVLERHGDATHIVYAALYEQPQLVRGWTDPEHVTTNLAMLRNLFDAVESSALEHVTLLQGTKAYGAHLGRSMRIPAKEREPRIEHENFYFAQEDWLRERWRQRDWRYTILRPQIVAGVAVGSAMNVVGSIGVYAALCKELKLPFFHPGHADTVTELTDARLLARACDWAASRPACDAEAYNITNGDVVCWRELFHVVADWLGVPLEVLEVAGGVAGLAQAMPSHAAVWRALALRHGLRVADLDAFVGLSWQYADVLWANPEGVSRPHLVSTLKARQHGFADCVDSEDSVIALLERMRSERYIP